MMNMPSVQKSISSVEGCMVPFCAILYRCGVYVLSDNESR